MSVRVKAPAAGIAAVVPLLVAESRERRRQDDERVRALLAHLRLVTESGDLPLVSELHDDMRGLEKLGVSPSRIAQEADHSDAPPYVNRERDRDLDRALREDHPFVLVVGASKAGKSRSAVEAMRRILGERQLVVPSGRSSLPALLDLGFKFPKTVVWLDDLENYLGADGLSRRVLERLIEPAQRPVTILATMRAKARQQFAPRSDLEPPEWKVLRQATVVSLDQRLSEEERAKARVQFRDHRLDDALDRYGLGEYLAAGPDLVHRLQDGAGANPVGVAIVRAAVDWQRVGFTRPTPANVLRALGPEYRRDGRNGVAFDQDTFDNGLTWATEELYATSALLAKETDGYDASDYVLDYFEGERLDSIPRLMWDVALDEARDASEILQVASAADTKAEWPVAQAALQRATADRGSSVYPAAANNFGVALEHRGYLDEAKQWYGRAAEAGHHDAAFHLGELLWSDDKSAEAERWYQMAAEGDHLDAAFRLGEFLWSDDKPEKAQPWYQRAAEGGHLHAGFRLGELLSGEDKPAAAEQWFRKAAEGGHVAAAYELGVLLKNQGDRDGAETAWRRAAEGGDGRAAYELGALAWSDRKISEAERWLRKAADRDHHWAAHELGWLLLKERGDRDGAALSWERAAPSEPKAAFQRAELLWEDGKPNEAEPWYRQAADGGHHYAGYQLGWLLRERGDLDGAEQAWRRAADGGEDKAAQQLRRLLKDREETAGP